MKGFQIAFIQRARLLPAHNISANPWTMVYVIEIDLKYSWPNTIQ